MKNRNSVNNGKSSIIDVKFANCNIQPNCIVGLLARRNLFWMQMYADMS